MERKCGRVMGPLLLGLGLSVVHGILAEHEASIEIESKHGSGTRVAIELVLCRPPEN